MPRGAKKDEGVTKLLLKNGLLLDKRSFVSLNANEPHLYLEGEDRSLQRMRVFWRSKRKCARCGREIFLESFHMDHKQGGLVGRCDCQHNLQALCEPCDIIKTRESEHH